MRLAVYGGFSSLLALGVIINAMHQRSNFYAACVYLSKSSACIMILLNMGLLLAICLGKTLQAIFFGSLRAIEVEHLYERSWYAVTETCLAMTIFRDEFNLQFVIVFTTLLFLKIFHWLCQDRVEFMEQSPSSRITFHVRMVNLMALLLIIDCVLARHAINITLTKGANMMVMFGFEYTILICIILSTAGKYILNVIDMRSEEPWEGKSMYVFYLDLLTDFLKLITYLVFFFFICYYYQLPLHIIRDVYVTFRSFIQKCRDLYRYRRATRNMNELYPNATAEDFARMNDSTCIICREEMQVIEDNNEAENAAPQNQQQNLDQPKKLPCGHVFHFHCLRSWLERQQSCPTCRRSVLAESNASGSTNQNRAQQPDQQQAQQQPQQPQQQQQQSPLNPVAGTDDNRHGTPYQQDPFASTSTQPNNVHYPPSNTQASPAFGVLTPDQSWATSSAGPGMIPLIPLSGASIPYNTPAGAPQNSNANVALPESLPESLTDEELQILSTTTREAMEQRLRILDSVQSQIFHSMQILTQALSVFPDTTTTTTTTTATQNTTPQSPARQPASLSTQAAAEASNSSKEEGTSLSSSATTEGGEGPLTSRERKGKMPEVGGSSNGYQIGSDEE